MTPVRLPKQMWKVDGDAVNDLYYLKCYFTVFLSSNEEESRAEQSREEILCKEDNELHMTNMTKM